MAQKEIKGNQIIHGKKVQSRTQTNTSGKTSLKAVTYQDIQINRRYMKVLRYKTPQEMLNEHRKHKKR